MVRIRFSVWLVSDYAHVFIVLPAVIVTFPVFCCVVAFVALV